MIAVTAFEKKSKRVFTRKFAEVKRGLVTLWSDCQTIEGAIPTGGVGR